jgi:organic hydroperoxide reductase OsmC/OhrA
MPTISAHVKNRQGSHEVTLKTNDRAQAITIAPKPGGFGSSANGGELLFLALATCYCNDIYREAARKNITVRSVQVEVSGTFGDVPGNVAQDVTYSATVEAEASEQKIRELMIYTDTVAEIQNTLRQVTSVRLAGVEARPVS